MDLIVTYHERRARKLIDDAKERAKLLVQSGNTSKNMKAVESYWKATVA